MRSEFSMTRRTETDFKEAADMATPDSCPCDAVKELKEIVARHDGAINESVTSRALINQKLDMLLDSTSKKKNNTSDIWKGAVIAFITLLISQLGQHLFPGA